MNSERVVELFKLTGALLEGHFLYASGRHGHQFMQAARVLQYPGHTEELCKAMAAKFADDAIDVVIGPATGGIVLAYEAARHLKGARAAFTEKDGEGGMVLRRGFAVKPGMRVLVVEDVTTTGGSIQKSIDHLRARGAEVVGVSVLIDRSGNAVTFDCRYEPLAQIVMESWAPEECDLCRQGQPVMDPDTIQL